MTATPREPTREEVEAALKEAESTFGPDRDRGQLYDYLRTIAAAYRNLLAQAPKVWTTEEWGRESPNGEYRVGNIHEDGGMLWSMFYRKENILESFVGYTHLYGPMDEQEGPDRIAPPPPEEKGG